MVRGCDTTLDNHHKYLTNVTNFICPQVLGEAVRGPEGEPDHVLQGPEDLQGQARGHLPRRAAGRPRQRRGHRRHRLHQEEARFPSQVSFTVTARKYDI